MVGSCAEGGAFARPLYRRLTHGFATHHCRRPHDHSHDAGRIRRGGLENHCRRHAPFPRRSPAFPDFDADPLGLVFLTSTPRSRLLAKEYMIVMIQAAAGSAGYSILMILALTLTTSANASVIHGLLPVLAALVATLALKERLGAKLWIA
ncbi:MAG: hypothetical protein E5Y00_18900, partial [Mesorhizobium sp.]